MRLYITDARCSGRFDLTPKNNFCQKRDTCLRFLSLIYYDRNTLANYIGIPVLMAMEDCEIYIKDENYEN